MAVRNSSLEEFMNAVNAVRGEMAKPAVLPPSRVTYKTNEIANSPEPPPPSPPIPSMSPPPEGKEPTVQAEPIAVAPPVKVISVKAATRTAPVGTITPRELKRAIVLSEILAPPLALRKK